MWEEKDEITELKAERFSKKISSGFPIFQLIRDEFPIENPKPVQISLPKKSHPASSLRKICCTILKMYIPKMEQEICLKKLAIELQTERRRVYDIVNILEAFDILVKKAKNMYVWKGLDDFLGKLTLLESYKIEGGQKNEKVFNFEFKLVKTKKKMLTYMSLRVLRFLEEQVGIISFGTIVRLCLCCDSQKDYIIEKRASTTRRLYDIVNVLNALGLISKVYDENHKKFYKWNGKESMARQISAYNQKLDDDQANTFIMEDFGDLTAKNSAMTIKFPELESENLSKNNNKREQTSKFQGFQLCKQFSTYPITEIKRLLSFSDGDLGLVKKSNMII